MKTARIALFLGVLVSSLISGRAPLHAQPSSAQVSVDGNDKPWNQGVPLATREAAKDLFLEGNHLFNIPVYTRAAEKYIAALAMWKHPAFYFNLGLAQLNLGQDVEARGSLEQALKYGPEPLGPERFQEARKQLEDLTRKLGRIRVSCETPGAEIALDGVTLFTGPGTYEGWLTAKTHEITAKKRDYLAQARRLSVSPGQLQVLDVRLVTLSEAADTGRRWAVWKPWAVVAAGAAIGAAGGVVHALSGQKFADYDKGFQQQPCAMSGGCTPDQVTPALNAQLHGATREQQIAVGCYIAGSSVIAAGIMLLYLNRPRLPEREPTSSSTQIVTVVPAASTSMLGITLYVSH